MRNQPSIQITLGNINDRHVLELLQFHVMTARAQTGRGSAHALDPNALRAPEINFWTAWDGEELLGIAALKQLTVIHGEIKSMHTAQAARRRGVGSAILRHIIDVAKQRGMSRLSLETGSWDYFQPARSFYRKHGFVECPPFGDYLSDPNSVFLTLDLSES